MRSLYHSTRKLPQRRSCHLMAAGPVALGSMALKKHPATWAEVAVKEAGPLAAMRALEFAMGWGLATAELSREPESVEEYAETMRVPVRTAYRHQQAFRKAYPGEASPGRMNTVTGAQDRYNEAWKRLKDVGKAKREMAAMPFWVGGKIFAG